MEAIQNHMTYNEIIKIPDIKKYWSYSDGVLNNLDRPSGNVLKTFKKVGTQNGEPLYVEVPSEKTVCNQTKNHVHLMFGSSVFPEGTSVVKHN
jgi:hypothetical protein